MSVNGFAVGLLTNISQLTYLLQNSLSGNSKTLVGITNSCVLSCSLISLDGP